MQKETEIWAVRGYGTGMKRFFRWVMPHLPAENAPVDFENYTYKVQRLWFDVDNNEIRIHLA